MHKLGVAIAKFGDLQMTFKNLLFAFLMVVGIPAAAQADCSYDPLNPGHTNCDYEPNPTYCCEVALWSSEGGKSAVTAFSRAAYSPGVRRSLGKGVDVLAFTAIGSLMVEYRRSGASEDNFFDVLSRGNIPAGDPSLTVWHSLGVDAAFQTSCNLGQELSEDGLRCHRINYP